MGIALLALLIRLIHNWATSQVPTARHLIGDAAGYYEWSQRIATGDWLGSKSFYQAPLYPYTLAVWHLFGSRSVDGIRALQSLWGSAACGLLCLAASRIFCPRVGIVSGLMLALFAPAIYFDGIVQKASLDCLLVCAMLAGISLMIVRCTISRCVLLGAIVSLLCLTRENAIAWHLVLIAWIAWWSGRETPKSQNTEKPKQEQRRTDPASDTSPHPIHTLPRYYITILPNVLAYALGAVIVLLPVGVRNYCVQGEFLLTTAQAGPNFYIGNSANADGRYQPLVRGHETPTFEQRDATQLAEQAAGRQLSPREVSHYWMGLAWRDIAADPFRWIRLTAYKLFLTWNEYEIADGESITIYSRHSPILGPLCIMWNFGGLAPLAILGIALTWNARSRLWVFYALIASMTFAVAAFYVLARYRYPLVPLLIPFAAAGCVEVWRRRRHLPTLVRPLCLAILAAMLTNWQTKGEDRLDAMAEMNAGIALAQAGEIEEAAQYFANAVAGHPTSAEANHNLAQALAVQGKYAEAIPYYETAIQSQPALIGVQFNLAVALERTGSAAQALKHFEIAVQQDPGDAVAQAAIKRLQPKSGD